MDPIRITTLEDMQHLKIVASCCSDMHQQKYSNILDFFTSLKPVKACFSDFRFDFHSQICESECFYSSIKPENMYYLYKFEDNEIDSENLLNVFTHTDIDMSGPCFKSLNFKFGDLNQPFYGKVFGKYDLRNHVSKDYFNGSKKMCGVAVLYNLVKYGLNSELCDAMLASGFISQISSFDLKSYAGLNDSEDEDSDDEDDDDKIEELVIEEPPKKYKLYKYVLILLAIKRSAKRQARLFLTLTSAEQSKKAKINNIIETAFDFCTCRITRNDVVKSFEKTGEFIYNDSKLLLLDDSGFQYHVHNKRYYFVDQNKVNQIHSSYQKNRHNYEFNIFYNEIAGINSKISLYIQFNFQEDYYVELYQSNPRKDRYERYNKMIEQKFKNPADQNQNKIHQKVNNNIIGARTHRIYKINNLRISILFRSFWFIAKMKIILKKLEDKKVLLNAFKESNFISSIGTFDLKAYAGLKDSDDEESESEEEEVEDIVEEIKPEIASEEEIGKVEVEEITMNDPNALVKAIDPDFLVAIGTFDLKSYAGLEEDDDDDDESIVEVEDEKLGEVKIEEVKMCDPDALIKSMNADFLSSIGTFDLKSYAGLDDDDDDESIVEVVKKKSKIKSLIYCVIFSNILSRKISRVSTVVFSNLTDELKFKNLDMKHPFKKINVPGDGFCGLHSLKILLNKEGINIKLEDLKKDCKSLKLSETWHSLEDLSMLVANYSKEYSLYTLLSIDESSYNCFTIQPNNRNPLYILHTNGNHWTPLVRCCFNNVGLRLKNLDVHGISMFKPISNASPISTNIIDKISVKEELQNTIKSKGAHAAINRYLYGHLKLSVQDSILIDTYLARLFPQEYVEIRKANTISKTIPDYGFKGINQEDKKKIENSLGKNNMTMTKNSQKEFSVKNKESQKSLNDFFKNFKPSVSKPKEPKKDWMQSLANIFTEEKEDYDFFQDFNVDHLRVKHPEPTDLKKDEEEETIEDVQKSDNAEQKPISLEDEEKEEDVDDLKVNLASDYDKLECCWSYKNLNVSNSHNFIKYLDQFSDFYPAKECLDLALRNISRIFELIHSSGVYTSETNKMLKSCVKFRHDVFSYIVLNSIYQESKPFGTDSSLEFLGSNRTPDYVDVQNKSIKIYEFSVVNNLLRGNIMKGIDAETSKYRREIIMAKNLGYEVSYFPILFSTGSSVRENIEYLEGKQITLAENFVSLLQLIIECIQPEHRYLIQLTFMDNPIKDSLSENREEKGWQYEYKKINLHRFLDFKSKALDLTDEYNYDIYFTKGSFFVSKDKGKYTGKFIKQLAKNEIQLLDTFKRELSGSKQFLIRSERSNSDYNCNLETHRIEEDPSDHLECMNNFLKFDRENENSFPNISDRMFNLKHGDLVEEFSQKSIERELENYKKRLAGWSVTRNTTPAVINSPRRSFYNLFDSTYAQDISYQAGIRIKYSGNSLSVKTMLAKLDTVKFEKRVVYSEKPNDYKNENQKIYDWLADKVENPHKRTFKSNRALLSDEDKSAFDLMRTNLKTLQNQYIKSVKGQNSGVLNLDENIKDMITSECNWKGGGLYKLYMGENLDIEILKKTMLSTTKQIAFKFNLPDCQDIGFLTDLKEIENAKLNTYLNEIICTNLMQCMLFHSRLCYTLLALSNRNESHRYAVLDNLGLENVLLIVKGGKKMLNTRKSKIFKLIAPCLPDLLEYNPGNSHNGEHNQNETSWMQMSQTNLLDGMALPYKFLCNYVSVRDKHAIHEAKEMLFLPAMLALHNRRKTEINLHNMRYFMVNVMGEFSQVESLLREFDTPCYTAFEKNLYGGFAENYIKYTETVVAWSELRNNSPDSFESIKVHHPILNRNIYNINDFTYSIYSTYMMSKSVDNQSVEQTINLEKIIETHNYYQKNQPQNSDDLGLLYGSDFNYSKICAYEVGKCLSAEVRKNHGVRSLQVKYDQIMKNNIDSIANNRGLRYEGKDFFGHKGYFVVYKKLIEEGLDKILDVIDNEELTPIQRLNKLKDLNKTFEKEQKTHKLEKATLHVVDKVQRGGPREIYVMDYNTKLHQSTIEKMFKIVCELIDNEMITVPSSKRANAIHRKNFEYKSEKYIKYYLTFDCRKWAPRSNFEKYIDMLEGMKEVLPYEFIEHVNDFFAKYKQKEIHTRKQIYDQLITKRPEFSEHFSIDEEKKSAFFTMPYSFVMGIFNMLSSLYHAGVQLLAEREVALKIHKKYGTCAILLLDAHSDDSQGTLNIEKNNNVNIKSIAKDSLSFYQHLQKANNHLMSVKKCNISFNYLEFLSVLYLNSELLPLLPKFLGNFSANFSGKGISQDFRSIVSKSIELQTNGESHASCYKIQIILSNFYRNFYRIDHDTSLPALGGIVSSWPPLYIYFGSCIDEVRLSYVNPGLFNRIMTFANKYMEFEPTEGTFSLNHISNSRVPRAYRELKKSVSLPEFQDNTWFFSQNKTRSAQINTLWFRAMLDDKHFMISLLNINEVRRAVDSYYYASRKSIICNDQMYNINELYASILKQEPEDISYYKLYATYFKSAIEFYEDLSMVQNFSIENKSAISFKPATISMNDMNDIPNPTGGSLSIATTICRPELTKYLFEDKLYDDSLDRFKEYLKENEIPLDIKHVKNFLDFCNKRREKTFSLYMRCPSNSRVLVGAEGMINHLVNNYLDDKKIVINQNNFRMLKREVIKVEPKIINYINACYLHHIAKLSKDNDLLMTKLNDLVGNIYLNNVYSRRPDIDKMLCDFSDYIARFDGTRVDLRDMQGFSLWVDKQYKVMGEWVGKGRLFVKLKNRKLVINTNNNVIVDIYTDATTDLIFTNAEVIYLDYLFKHSNLKFEFNPSSLLGHHFGYNKSGILGIHKGDFIRVGVPCFINQSTEQYFIDTTVTLNYEYGKFIIKNNSDRYHLITFDYLCYNINKGRLFDILDWDNLSSYQKNLFMDTAASGDFGNVESLNYISQDLIDNFIKTDIYKTFYKKTVKEKVDLLKFFWSDVVNSSTTSDEFLPVMFENTSLHEINKILPESKKENLKILQYFNVDNKLLFDFKRTLSSLDNDSQKSEYLMKVLSDLGNAADLVKLPEIGDPNFFSKIINNQKIQLPSLNQMISDLSNALTEAYNELPALEKQKISKSSKKMLNYEFFLSTFYDFFSSKDYVLNDFSAFTNHTLIVHSLLRAIFENQSSLLVFSKSLRRTSLSLAPRHPRYQNDWQSLLASFYKKCATINVKQESLDLIGSFAKKYVKKLPHVPKEDEPLFAPVIDLFYDINFEMEEVDYYKSKLFELNNFYTTTNVVDLSLMIVDDWADENDEEFHRIRAKEGKNDFKLFETAECRRLKGPVATQYYVPLKKVMTKYVKDKKYYLYNFNADIAKERGWREDSCSREIKLLKDFQENYKSDYMEIAGEIIESKDIPDFVRPVTEFVKVFNLHDPAVYNEDLVEYISKRENLDEEQEKDLREIILDKRSPITKAMIIAKIINNKVKKFGFEDLIEDVLKNFTTETFKIDNESEKMLMLDYRIAGKNKKQMILKASGYKKELMQLDEILDGNLSEAIVRNVKLDSVRKLTLLNHINAVLKYFKAKKDKNKMAFFGFLKDFIRQIEIENHCNREGLKLEETLRTIINNNSTDVDEDDDSDLFSEPEETTKQWVINRKRP
jgi:hypothetical protein